MLDTIRRNCFGWFDLFCIMDNKGFICILHHEYGISRILWKSNRFAITYVYLDPDLHSSYKIH